MPTVTGVSPRRGLTAGGNVVNITGTQFTGATNVYFNQQNASFSIVSASSINAIAPKANVGQVNVTVTTPSGTSALNASATYEYVTVLPSGGTSITISTGTTPSPTPVSIVEDASQQIVTDDPFGFPFSFSNGKIVKVKSDSDEYAAQRIASAVSIGFNELPLRPIFGSNSPEFVGFDTGSFLLTCGNYFQDIEIIDTEEIIDNNGQARIKIEFKRNV